MKCIYGCVFSITLYFRSEEIHMRLFLKFYVSDYQNYIPTKISVSTSNVLFFWKHQIYTVYPLDMVVFCYTKSYQYKWIMKTLLNINNNNKKYLLK